MSEPKFTPGPWAVDWPGEEATPEMETRMYVTLAKSGDIVAELTRDEIGKADAALIAAAPLLYQLADEMLTALHAGEDGPPRNCHLSLCRRASAALRAARGET